MNKQVSGYYRFPAIHGDRLVFVTDDDIWAVMTRGGTASRLSANVASVANPNFSPDGKWIAFTGAEEGPTEVYLMPAMGGQVRRLTYLGALVRVIGWSGKKVLFTSNHGQPLRRPPWIFSIAVDGSPPERLPYGPASSISLNGKRKVLGRYSVDLARWKRYRGGTAGQIWVDARGAGTFKQLVNIPGNLANPLWLGDRIYFLSDEGGIGNLYSCAPDGTDLQQHTRHKTFYARNATTDGQRIVYQCGADIFIYDSAADTSRKVPIEYHSVQPQRSRKFVPTRRYLEDYDPGRNGAYLALVSRGKSFVLGCWDGPVRQQSASQGIRHRLSRLLNDDKRIVLVSDAGGDDHLEIHVLNKGKAPILIDIPALGRPMEMKVSPQANHVLITNHRNELYYVNLDSSDYRQLDHSPYRLISGFNWSPDGRWAAYGVSVNPRQSIIRIAEVASGKTYDVTDAIRHDGEPAFDPRGRFLAFISCRVFDPVYDQIHFDAGFPRGMRPYLVTLRKDDPSPLIHKPRGFSDKDHDHDKDHKSDKKLKVSIDFEDIKDRIIELPVSEAIYDQITVTKNRIYYSVLPIEGSLGGSWSETEPAADAKLKFFNLKRKTEKTLIDGITGFVLSRNHCALAIRDGNDLRVLSADIAADDVEDEDMTANRKTGWIDLYRPKVEIDPVAEWRQMLIEAWRLQRDYFWVEDMSGINWQQILKRYLPLVDRIATRGEFSDLIWEMQGELGTSHCYELGGDYRPRPKYQLGFLGTDLSYTKKHNAYRIDRIIRGDTWDEDNAPPLKRPGINIKQGMLLLSVNNQPVDRNTPPGKLLINRADEEVRITVASATGKKSRTVTVKTLKHEYVLRYRDWVETMRDTVHEKTNGKVGFIHIPDMAPHGYAEFHRYFLAELDHQGLIVDVRFNGGGHVSQLLLEKLARKRLGYDLTRWMGYEPYPVDSVRGPMVAITNELAGSDGDLFSHNFKLMGLGPLIGKRTWGGVIGIWPRNSLVDGSLTTQPEFSFWFTDAGWRVENYGTDPDIEVDISPQDYTRDKDPQLERAIKEVLKLIKLNPPLEPDFGNRPKLGLTN